ncbi:MAG TPA: hypothetical protein VI775_00315 [Candidatus Paceibacterota bacterium]
MKGIDRILSTIGIKDIIDVLSSKNLNWADFHTLLLHIFEKRIEDVSPVDVMRNYKENRFSAVADTDQRELIEIDRFLYRVLPSYFLAVELSPVNSIGANATLTTLDSKVVLSTIRNMEVVGDPSMTLAIECAHRRRFVRTIKENLEVHLATSHRALRLQNFPRNSGLTSHFRAFALASAARDIIGFNKFELVSLSAHIEAWLNFLMCSLEIGYRAQNLSVAISDVRIAERLILDGRVSREEVIHRAKDKTFNIFNVCSIDLPDQIDYVRDISVVHPELETYIRELQFTEKQMIEPLRNKYPSVHFYFDLGRCSGMGYYSGICYKLVAQNVVGNKYQLAGGGACNWTRKLLNSKKEHLITGGFGTEMFSKLFKEA